MKTPITRILLIIYLFGVGIFGCLGMLLGPNGPVTIYDLAAIFFVALAWPFFVFLILGGGPS